MLKYNITFDDVAKTIRENNVNLTAGKLKLDGLDIIIRAEEKGLFAKDIEKIDIITTP